MTRYSIALTFIVLTISAPANAQLDLSWSTIDCGGGASAGGPFDLSGTIGQPDTGSFGQPMTGGTFELVGGFWSAAAPSEPCVGDVNGDRQVTLNDLTILLANFGMQSGATLATGDLNGDHAVDLADLTILLSQFGTICT